MTDVGYSWTPKETAHMPVMCAAARATVDTWMLPRPCDVCRMIEAGQSPEYRRHHDRDLGQQIGLASPPPGRQFQRRLASQAMELNVPRVFCHVRGRRPSDAKAAAMARYAWMSPCDGFRVVMILQSFCCCDSPLLSCEAGSSTLPHDRLPAKGPWRIDHV